MWPLHNYPGVWRSGPRRARGGRPRGRARCAPTCAKNDLCTRRQLPPIICSAKWCASKSALSGSVGGSDSSNFDPTCFFARHDVRWRVRMNAVARLRRTGRCTSSLHTPDPRLFAHSVPVYPLTLAASSSLACPLVPCSAQPKLLLTGYQCTRTHSPLPRTPAPRRAASLHK